jgi:glycosyltransferase involved in cell wall biosynthesis
LVAALFVGRLAHHKGIEHLVHAAAHVGPEVRILIAGSGPRRAHLETLARRIGQHHKVTFLGRVERDELPPLIAASDLLVLPSVTRLEAFGIAALEAMAAGRPVVVTDIPGVREVVEAGVTGLTARPLDPRDLAARIRELAEDPALRASMGAQGRKRVEAHFATPRVVDRLEAVYRDVLRR